MSQPETISLYGGEVLLEYDDLKHTYTVDGKRVPTVTQILSVVSKGDALTNWAANTAAELFREGVQPGQSYDECYLDALLTRAKGAHRTKKQEAADVGTQAHRLIENHLKGQENDIVPGERSVRCFEAATRWMDDHSYLSVSTERRLYSRKFGCSGTCDWLAYVDGKKCVVDWKSSKSLYPEFMLQTAAYAYMVGEEDGKQPTHRWIIQLGKDDGKFHPYHFGPKEQREDFKAFVGAFQLWKRLRVVEGGLRKRKP